nr:MAG TPA: NUMOD4 motif protein [Caudoviricetes sp.]
MIKNYPSYLVSNYGRILNKNTNRLLKGCISNNGYPEVNLW